MSDFNPEWIVISNDDMWFHRYWDIAAMDIIQNHKDCGIVSLYNYTNIRMCGGKIIDDTTISLNSTGLGAAFIYVPVWLKYKFYIDKGSMMGFFANHWCFKVSKMEDIERRHVYMPIPYYVTHMDNVKCPLNMRHLSEKSGYSEFRTKHKGK